MGNSTSQRTMVQRKRNRFLVCCHRDGDGGGNLYPQASGRARAAEASPHSPPRHPGAGASDLAGKARGTKGPRQEGPRAADRLLALAAGIAFYSLVALFP